MKSLVVDDSSINLKVTQKILEKLGLEVEMVLSGVECLEIVQEKSFDIIFMDIMMPEMDGVETLNKLKEIDGFNIPVVALTADVDDYAREKYLSLGINDYIGKPINIEEIKQIIEKFCNLTP